MAVITRKVRVIEYASGEQVRVPIPRQHFYQRLRLKVKLGNLVGGGAFVTGAENKMVARLELVIGGQLTVRNLSFEDLRKVNLLSYKDQVPADGYAFLDLGFLPSHLFTSLDLLVTFAAIGNITTGGTTGLTGATVSFYARESINEGQTPAAIPLVIHKTIERSVADVAGDVDIDIRDGQVIQAVLIMPSSGTLINTVSVVQDGVKFLRAAEPWADLQEENKADFELDAAPQPEDFAVVNFDVFGNGAEALRTKTMDTLDLRLNLNSEPDGKVRLLILAVQAPAA